MRRILILALIPTLALASPFDDIYGSAPSGTASGDLSGTYPSPTVAKINGVALGTTTATAGRILAADGSAWQSVAVSGDVAITSAGVTSVNSVKSATTTINLSSATAPSSGQVLTATSSTAATWQTPTGGGGAWMALSLTGAPVTEGDNLAGPFRGVAGGNFRQIACNWGVAGTGGSTGVVAEIKVDGGSALCSCTLGACTTASGTAVNCDCNTAYSAATTYVLQIKSTTDCATNPTNVVCNVGTN